MPARATLAKAKAEAVAKAAAEAAAKAAAEAAVMTADVATEPTSKQCLGTSTQMPSTTPLTHHV
jgi:hypothetical protein